MKFKNLLPACCLVLAAFVVAGDAVAQSEQKKEVRVMSFNIRYDEPRDGANAWPNRKSKVADIIRTADAIGVQEALLTQLHDLETVLPDFAWCGAGRTDGKEAGEISAIFYRKSRLKLLEDATFWLSETPDKPGSMGWDAAYPRVVTWAKFYDNQTRKRFYHFNTHFDHRGEKARVESARLLLKQIEIIAKKTELVVTGDLNFTESAEAYKVLTAGRGLRLKDARYSSETAFFGPTSTFNAFKELLPEMKIDYIFIKGKSKVLKHGAVADRPGGLWPSDHLPVIAEIVIR